MKIYKSTQKYNERYLAPNRWVYVLYPFKDYTEDGEVVIAGTQNEMRISGGGWLSGSESHLEPVTNVNYFFRKIFSMIFDPEVKKYERLDEK